MRGGRRPGAGRPRLLPFTHARHALERALGFIDRLPPNLVAERVRTDPVWRRVAQRLGADVGTGGLVDDMNVVTPGITDRQGAVSLEKKEMPYGNL